MSRGDFDPDSDDLLDEAIRLVVQTETASVSMIQRRLRVGYTRAGRLIDMLERRGVISGYEGSKPRQVLITEADLNRVLGRASDRLAIARAGRRSTPTTAHSQDFSPVLSQLATIGGWTTGIGATLRKARNRRKVGLSEVETATKIRLRYLRAMENEEWDVLPGGAYTRGFIRTYASFLGLDGERLADEYRRGAEDGTPEERAQRAEPVVSPPRAAPTWAEAFRPAPGRRSSSPA